MGMTTRYALTTERQSSVGELLTVLVTLVLPPLGVLIRVGWHPHLLVSTLLTLFGWLPGVLHGVWVLGRFPYRLRASYTAAY